MTEQAITPLSKQQGLFDGNVYPLLEDRSGGYWIGAFSALSLERNGKITNFTRQNGLLYEIVQSLFEDKDGRIWIGSVGGVEYLENGKFVDFTKKLGLPFGDFDFWDIYQAADGAMWFATDKGLLKYDAGKVTKFTVENGLPSSDVKKILRTSDGNLWFGTLGGLARFDGEKFASFTEKDGLPGNHVRTIYEDAENLLWIGTYDSGLALFRNNGFTKITLENGLFSNGVFAILPDERGNFWISSNQGIYRVNRQQLIDFADGKIASVTSTAFGKSDGMLNVECNGGRQPAGIKSSDGKLRFPTQDGVAIVDPEAVAFNPLPPPVVIENVKIENQPLENFQTGIEIQPGQANLEIGYTGLSFIKPEQIRFRYKLEGLDKDWTSAGERRTAYFSYLPPGSYTFHIAAANSDNVWNETGATLLITVKPAFYRTWWFYALLFLAGFSLLYTAFRYRVSQVEKKRRGQEEFSRKLMASQEQERQRIAAELHDTLGQSLLIIKNRVALAQTDIDEKEVVEEQLSELSSSATAAIEECREIAYNLRPYQLSRFGLSKTLAGIFNRIGEVTTINAATEIDDIDDFLSPESEINVYRIVQESVNNIIKHSGASEALLVVKKSGDEIILLIEDNGRGFVPDAEPKSKSGGFGLIGIAERVKMLHGTCEINSASGSGTSIRIKLSGNHQNNGN